MIAHLGILRSRINALRSDLERAKIEIVLRDLELIHRLMPKVEGTRLASRARWIRDCLDEEIHEKLRKAEAT